MGLVLTDPNWQDWWSNLTSAVSNTASAVSSAASTASSAITNALNSIPPLVQSIGNQVVSIFNSIATPIANSLSDAGQRAAKRIAQGAQAIVSQASQALQIVSNVATSVTTALQTAVSGLGGALAVVAASTFTAGALMSYASIAAQQAARNVNAETALTGILSIAPRVALPYIGAGLVAFGAGYALGYVLKEGNQATPEGAINAFVQGSTLPIAYVTHWLS